MSEKSSEIPSELQIKRDEFGKERKQIMIDCGHHFTVGIVADQHVFLGFNKCFKLMIEREQKLLEVISVLKEACGFYGDADNWEKTSPLHYLKINNADLIIRDISLLAHIGGKTANEALAKVEDLLKSIKKDTR